MALHQTRMNGAIFVTQQNETLNTGEDSSKAGGLEDKGKFY